MAKTIEDYIYREKEEREIPKVEYSEKELKCRDEVIRQLNDAYNQRNQTYMEFDDMTYDMWYLANKRAGEAYNKPRKNAAEIKINTGVTREKVNTIVTALMKYNYLSQVVPFDKESVPDMVLGKALEDMIIRSKEMEKVPREQKEADWMREFVSQGNIFILESWEEEIELEKKLKNVDIEDISKMKWTEKEKLNKFANSVMIPGPNVYLGNIRERHMDNQPFFGIREELPYSVAMQRWGKWGRWKNVPRKVVRVLHDQGQQLYQDWNMIAVDQDVVEVVRYYNLVTNTYQILLNGVMMLPPGFPLSYLIGVNKSPLVKADGEPIPNFAYSRGISAKNKFNQETLDEFYRLIVLGFRQTRTPAMSNMTGKILNKSIFNPATVHKNIDVEKLKPILPQGGVNASEFEIFKLVQNTMSQSSISPVFEGQQTPGEQTAKEIEVLQSQSLMRLGFIMVGRLLLEDQLAERRLYNCLAHWTKEQDAGITSIHKSIYRMSVESTFEDGKRGQHVIEFVEGDVPQPEQVMAETEMMKKRWGGEFRKTYIDARKMRSTRYRFDINTIPTDKEVSQLKSMVEMESLERMMAMFPESINRPYLQERMAFLQKLDGKKLFNQNSTVPEMPMAEGRMSEDGRSPQGTKGVTAQALPLNRKPSLRQMVQQ